MSKTKIDLTDLPIGTMVENREGEIGFYAGPSSVFDQAEGQPFNYYFASGEESFSYDGRYFLDEAGDNDIVKILYVPMDESATKRIAELEKENADLVKNIPLVTDRTVAEAREILGPVLRHVTDESKGTSHGCVEAQNAIDYVTSLLATIEMMEKGRNRKALVAQIMAGFCANPSVFAHNASCGWKLVNCDEDQLVDYANHLAGKIESL